MRGRKTELGGHAAADPRVGNGAIFRSFLAMSSFIAMVRVITPYSSEALAGYTIAIRVILFVLLPAWGLRNAATTLVGQNLGARQPDRAEHAVWVSVRFNLVFFGLAALLLFFFPGPLVQLFTESAETVRYGAQCLHVVSYGYLMTAFGIVLMAAFNGAGDTTTPAPRRRQARRYTPDVQLGRVVELPERSEHGDVVFVEDADSLPKLRDFPSLLYRSPWLSILEEWEEGQGFIAGFGDGGQGGFIEVTQVAVGSETYDEAFAQAVANDKIVLQLRTEDLDAWVRRLEGVLPVLGPVDRPWGNRYLWLRDPDGVQIALFEGRI